MFLHLCSSGLWVLLLYPWRFFWTSYRFLVGWNLFCNHTFQNVEPVKYHILCNENCCGGLKLNRLQQPCQNLSVSQDGHVTGVVHGCSDGWRVASVTVLFSIGRLSDKILTWGEKRKEAGLPATSYLMCVRGLRKAQWMSYAKQVKVIKHAIQLMSVHAPWQWFSRASTTSKAIRCSECCTAAYFLYGRAGCVKNISSLAFWVSWARPGKWDCCIASPRHTN